MYTDEQLEAFARAVPFSHHLGIELVELTKERVVCEVVPRPEHATTANTTHGGFLMAVADFAGACGAFFNLPEGCSATTTTESKTNMIRPGPIGDKIVATATPINVGRKLQVWQTRIETVEGKLISLTTQSQINL